MFPNQDPNSTEQSFVSPTSGEHLPLSVYKQRGYDAQALKNIEANADKEWNPVLGAYTYRLDVKSASVTDTDFTTSEGAHANQNSLGHSFARLFV